MGAAGRARRRAVTGILVLDKPPGVTSNRALQTVRRLYDAAKAGHTGSLDPLATGMLPVCFGAATKISGLLLAARKCYRVTAAFGAATDTGDADGKVVARSAVPEHDAAQIAAALAKFRGEIEQIPPMYSALKHEGRRLYTLARRGVQVERKPRRVEIHRVELEEALPPSATFVVECSKGTYIRSLVEDVAAALGTLGHVTALRRLWVAPYGERQMIAMERLEALAAEGGREALDGVLLPPDSALADWPMLSLDAQRAARLRHGERLAPDAAWPAGRVRIYAPGPCFLGVGTVLDNGELEAQRLFLQ